MGRPTFQDRIHLLAQEKEMIRANGEPNQSAISSALKEWAAEHPRSGSAPNPNQVRDWLEKRDYYPRVPTLILVADYWGVTLDFLLGRTEERHAPWMTRKRPAVQKMVKKAKQPPESRRRSPQAR